MCTSVFVVSEPLYICRYTYLFLGFYTASLFVCVFEYLYLCSLGCTYYFCRLKAISARMCFCQCRYMCMCVHVPEADAKDR